MAQTKDIVAGADAEVKALAVWVPGSGLALLRGANSTADTGGQLYAGIAGAASEVSQGVTVLASASRTTTQTQADQTNPGARGVMVVLDITVNAGSAASLTLEIDGKDPVSGKYFALLTSAAVSAVGTTVYRVYPGLSASANVTANDVLPHTWRVVVTPADASPATYSVGASLLV